MAVIKDSRKQINPADLDLWILRLSAGNILGHDLIDNSMANIYALLYTAGYTLGRAIDSAAQSFTTAH